MTNETNKFYRVFKREEENHGVAIKFDDPPSQRFSSESDAEEWKSKRSDASQWNIKETDERGIPIERA